MNITKENLNELSAIIKIELQKEDYEPAVNDTLKNLQKTYNMPGFRPGKVPSGLISKMFRSKAIIDEVDKLVSNSLFKYIEDNSIDIIGSPLSDTERQQEIDFDDTTVTNYDFYFKIALAPQLDINLDDITATKYEIEVEDDFIQKYIDDTCKHFGTIDNKESIDDINSYVVGDLSQLNEDNSVMDNGISSSDSTIAIDKIADKDIQDTFIGKKVGDTVIFNPITAFNNPTEVATMLNIKTNEAKELTSNFIYTIKKITYQKPAEVNEELFKKVYPQDEIHSLEEYKERIKKDAMMSFSAETDNLFSRDVNDTLMEKYKFDMDEEFVKQWLISTNEKSDKHLTAEELDKDFEKYAQAIRFQFISAAIEKKYNIAVTAKDVENNLHNLFMGYMPSTDAEAEERAKIFVDSFMKKDENKEQIRNIYEHLVDKEVQKAFNEHVKIETKVIKYQDFIELANKKA